MSSRRNLKKQINESMDLLYTDCVLYKVYTKEPNIEKADELISRIANIHIDFLSRANITEGKDVKNRVKIYYKKLKEDLKAQVDELGREIQNLD
ncbi:MAG TPA: hypothetical protein DIT04_08055 [Dysgonomonas sp.]|nr:hypothetical protein [Dysgonomonas sp.]